MRRVFLALLALSACGCHRTTEPTPVEKPTSINVSCIGENACSGGGAGNQPGVTVNPLCSQIVSVKVRILFDGERSTLAVGETVTMDATAAGSSGSDIGVICPVQWLKPQPDGCAELSGELNDYNPKLKALKTGSCVPSVIVGNGSGSRVFTIQ